MKKTIGIISYVLLFFFLLTGCGPKIVAIVNGEKITENELNKKLQQIAAMHGYDLETQGAEEYVRYLQEQALQSLIDVKILLQDAKTRKITVSKDIVLAEHQKIKDQWKDRYSTYLAERKFTENDLLAYIENNLILNLLFEEITAGITKTSRDVRAYYEENKTEFYQPEQVRASNIVVQSEKEALEVIKRLDAGEDFGDLAVELSIDPTAKQTRGDIGYFNREAALVKEFKEAAFSLKVGEYANKPIRTMHGYHIIKVEDKKEAKNRTFEEVREELENRFILEEKNVFFSEHIDSLEEKSVIKKFLNGEDAIEKPTA